MRSYLNLLLSGLVVGMVTDAAEAAGRVEVPRVSDNRLVVELVASEPDIVTPTGIAVDKRGRLLVLENHSHFRPKDYKGPTSDRIRLLDKFDASGRAGRVRTFADGFQNAMSIMLGRNDEVYVATRTELILFRGDDVADERKTIIKLKGAAKLPHKGLAGFAIDPLDNVYFTLGENNGHPCILKGSDGTVVRDNGVAGGVFRCKPNGSKLARVATGFWNPFNLTFDGFGRLFLVDNDPDWRPCRLLHIVERGDYGYRFCHGQKSRHPFSSWHGNVAGTLPMVSPTAQAPCGIVAYESNGLPQDYCGDLLVTSWADHVVQRFRLTPQGASFSSTSQILVEGLDDFRPVAIAIGPYGSVYLTDWVDRSYAVHRRGRIWRIRPKIQGANQDDRRAKVKTLAPRELSKLLSHPRLEIRFAASEALTLKRQLGLETLEQVLRGQDNNRARLHALWAAARLDAKSAARLIKFGLDDKSDEIRAEATRLLGVMTGDDADAALLEAVDNDSSPLVRLQAIMQLSKNESAKKVLRFLSNRDPFLAGAAITVLSRPGLTKFLVSHAQSDDPRRRLGVLLALRRSGDLESLKLLPKYLKDPQPAIRCAALRWIAEEKLTKFEPLLESALSRQPITSDVLESFLAARDFLAAKSSTTIEPGVKDQLLARIVCDTSRSPELRALALRKINPQHEAMDSDRLSKWIETKHERLRLEIVRTLAGRTDKNAQGILRRIAVDLDFSTQIRAEAVVGLGYSAHDSRLTKALLFSLVNDTSNTVRNETLRSLRGVVDSREEAQKLVKMWYRIKAKNKNQRELADQILAAFGRANAIVFKAEIQSIVTSTTPRPKTVEDWRLMLDDPGDAAAGERVFFHPRGAKCFACHMIDGRGNSTGPDLTGLARGMDREKIVDSLLDPRKDIAPLYQTWSVSLTTGKTINGIVVHEDSKELILADAEGKRIQVKISDIETRSAQRTSIMPEMSHSNLTPQEFRDLVAYLSNLR